jgi:hypothetical protein
MGITRRKSTGESKSGLRKSSKRIMGTDISVGQAETDKNVCPNARTA